MRKTDKQPVDIAKATNIVYNEVKRKLEDSKTSWFIGVMALNLVLWGLMLASYRDNAQELQDLKDKFEVVQIYYQQLKAEKE